MKAKISSTFNTPADRAWSAIRESKTLLFVTKGFLGFQGAEKFPEKWVEGRTEKTRLLFFGVIPGWNHQLHFTEISDVKREQFTKEGGGLISQWNHLIKVEPINSSQCQYTDEIEIKAGIFTPLVWLYANTFYHYRQFRWRKLINSGYNIA
jgi:hypothetical protein